MTSLFNMCKFIVNLSFFLCNKGVTLDEIGHMKAMSTESGTQNTKGDMKCNVAGIALTLTSMNLKRIETTINHN